MRCQDRVLRYVFWFPKMKSFILVLTSFMAESNYDSPKQLIDGLRPNPTQASVRWLELSRKNGLISESFNDYFTANFFDICNHITICGLCLLYICNLSHGMMKIWSRDLIEVMTAFIRLQFA